MIGSLHTRLGDGSDSYRLARPSKGLGYLARKAMKRLKAASGRKSAARSGRR